LKRILFVCSGNTCRSPLAEGIARKLLSASGRDQWVVSSAGTSAAPDLPASDHSVEVARRNGVDIAGHRSRPLDAESVGRADLIVTMGSRHRASVGMLDGNAVDYTYLLSEFCDSIDGDVPDPIGGGVETYERTFNTIRACVEELVRKLDDFDGFKRAD
jgi:protein-tyrosine-phosphatase